METCKQIRAYHPYVSWTKVVWFPQAILRISFITWLLFKDRLPTIAKKQSMWMYPTIFTVWGEQETIYSLCVLTRSLYRLTWSCFSQNLVWILTGLATTIVSLLFPRRKEIDACLLKLMVGEKRQTAPWSSSECSPHWSCY